MLQTRPLPPCSPQIASWLCSLYLLLWAGLNAAQTSDSADREQQDIAARAVSLLSFVAVDYPEAVQEGAVADRSLYRQTRDNAEFASGLVEQLPDRPGRTQLLGSLQSLNSAIADKASAEAVRRQANAAADRLAALYQLPRSPAESLPPASEARALYQDRCQHCHGIDGAADQPERALNDPVRMANLSLYDFYNVLEPTRNDAHDQAVDGDLSSRQRWALAVKVASFSAPQLAPAPKLAKRYPALVGLPGIAVLRPATLPQEARESLMWWRAHPVETRALQHPLARAAGLLYLAQSTYRSGDAASAYHQIMLALRTGYQPARAQLAARNPALATQLDQQWQGLRDAILQRAPSNEVIEKFQRLLGNVVKARELLQPTGGGAIYGWAALLFLAALAVGALLWFGLRRRRTG
ncbi:hypothetical protein HXX02_10595 [Microbulbifer elongatus]|uniref:High-affinity iron transporter n=1 Tax=Microbulbifer elongatus TaxID=86173 RepID=A0ABT1P1C3_9GAMM|nr:cytochrome c [Microbulbifer elongatus]MCQ3829893.1 hypothetical protein [Microbulbifer elongatus]